MRQHLGVASWVAGEGAITGGHRVVVAAEKIICHAEPGRREVAGAVKTKRPFEPWQALCGSARPYRDAAAVSIVVGIARIDFERTIELPESKIITFTKKIDIGEKAIRARSSRIQRQCLLRERFRLLEFLLSELGPPLDDRLVIRTLECCIGVGVVGTELDRTLKEFACLIIVVARCMRKEIPTTQHIFVCCQAVRRLCQSALLLEAGEFYGCRPDDAFGDIVLD